MKKVAKFYEGLGMACERDLAAGVVEMKWGKSPGGASLRFVPATARND